MADRLTHDIFTLLSFGRSYDDIHEKKDKPSQRLGRWHRRVHHKWYQAYGQQWDFAAPFPPRITEHIEHIRLRSGGVHAERYSVSLAHDYYDRIWDCEGESQKERQLSRRQKKAFYIVFLLHPALLKEKAGVDVLEGRILRVIDGVEVWEEEPSLKADYKMLCKRAYQRLHFDSKLRRIVEGVDALLRQSQKDFSFKNTALKISL